jgi:hypothetical protein
MIQVQLCLGQGELLIDIGLPLFYLVLVKQHEKHGKHGPGFLFIISDQGAGRQQQSPHACPVFGFEDDSRRLG